MRLTAVNWRHCPQKARAFVEDLGSGVTATEDWADGHETTRAVLKAGVTSVFSGDKLLGGPQSGIIAGKANTWPL